MTQHPDGIPLRALMAFYFFPRGGSAYVTRYLFRFLTNAGVRTRLLTGSLRSQHEHSDATVFFRGCTDVLPIDYTSAVDAWHGGADPLQAELPLHASYEDRDGAPDRVMGAMSPEILAFQENFWAGVLRRGAADEFDLLHLHHLTPQLAPAIATGKPVIVHLHGTDLKFLDACRDNEWRWPYADYWLPYFRDLLKHTAQIVAVSPGDAALAADMLRLPADAVTVIPNGVDINEFDTMPVPVLEQRRLWRRWLVTEPRGWDETGEVGSVRYPEVDLDRLFPLDGSRRTVLCVARFLTFKRLTHLLETWARVRDVAPPATLVVWGGFPGEVEGRHPVTVARELGLQDVVFTGFRGHDDLRLAFNMTDLLVNAARHEPFGQLLVQAMACGLPVLAAASGGPVLFVRPDGPERNGWLFQPGATDSFEHQLLDALRDPHELRLRGRNARDRVRGELSWTSVGQRFIDLYQSIVPHVNDTTGPGL